MATQQINVMDEVLVHRALKSDAPIPVPEPMPEGEGVDQYPGLETKSIGFFTIRNVHTIGWAFNTTVLIFAGIIEYENEQRIVLCTLDHDMIKANEDLLITAMFSRHARWWLTPKTGDLSSD